MPHIWTILILKLHIPVREVQLKSMKMKISKVISLRNYRFSLKKITGTKTDFMRGFIINWPREFHGNKNKRRDVRGFKMGNVYILSPFGSTRGNLAHYFNVIIWVLSCLLQRTIPEDYVLKRSSPPPRYIHFCWWFYDLRRIVFWVMNRFISL